MVKGSNIPRVSGDLMARGITVTGICEIPCNEMISEVDC